MKVRFTPLPDITPYELAVVVSKCTPHVSVRIETDQWAALPKGVRRHFVEEPGMTDMDTRQVFGPIADVLRGKAP